MNRTLSILACAFLSLGCSPSQASPTPTPSPTPEPQKPKPTPTVGAKLREATRSYFVRSLGTTTTAQPTAPDQALSLGDLTAHREELWRIWREANNAYTEEKLPASVPIAEEMSSHVWSLADERGDEGVRTARMPFYYGHKGVRPAVGYPLFLYLHGSGPKAQEWINGRRFAAYFQDGPSLYFVPQIPNEGSLYRWWQRSKLQAWEKLLRLAFLSEEVDPLRIHFFGISEGGYGSQRLASYYADYLAGAGPMAGGEPLINAPVENCQHIAFSLRTGARDTQFHRDQLTRITQEAFEVQSRLFPGYYEHFIELIPEAGHAIPYEPTTPWLSRHRRTPQPKSVHWEDYPVDGVYRRGFYNLQTLTRPEGTERLYYEEEIKGNTIELKVSTVRYTVAETSPTWGFPMRYSKDYSPASSGKLRLYLSPELVDLTQPVRILINGREIYAACPTLSWRTLVESCATFFDPQRLFPVAIDLEY